MDLITNHLDIWTTAQEKKTGGRGKRNNNNSIYGIKKLRELILDLAIRGKLVPHHPDDEPASKLLQRIAKEKEQLIKAGKIKNQKLLPQVSEDEESFELPIAWKWENLSGIVAVVTDGDHQAPPKSDTGVPFLVIGNLNSGNVVLDGCRFVPDTYYEKLDWARRPTKGDILYTVTGSYGIPIQVHGIEPFCVQRHVAILKATSITPSRYLSLVLASNHAFKYATEVATGIAQKTIPLTRLREMPIPIPPLAEQHRIVTKVDELMALCDQLEQQQTNNNATHQTLVKILLATLTHPTTGAGGPETNSIEIFFQHFDTLFTTEQSIDQLKQTILQLAVMGKLVPQDPGDEPASTLLKRISEEKERLTKAGKIKKQKPLPDISSDEKLFELPEGWQWTQFTNLATEISTGPFGTMVHKQDYVDGGTPLINPSHMIDSIIVEDLSVAVSKKKATELSSYKLDTGDIVLARRGELGRCALVTQRETGWLCGTGSFNLKFHADVCRKFVLTLFSSDYVRTYLGSTSVGATMTNLNHGILNKMPIAIPPVNEQHRIVAEVEGLMALCDTIGVRLNDARKTQTQLADSISDKAAA